MSALTEVFRSVDGLDTMNPNACRHVAYRDQAGLVQLHTTWPTGDKTLIEGFTSVEDASRYMANHYLGEDLDVAEYLGITGLRYSFLDT